jgi:uncharacterized protein (DUF2147 family)
MKKAVIFLFGVVNLFFWMNTSLMAQRNKADDISGIWLNEERTAKVQIYKEGEKFFGKIVWLKVTIDSITGKPRTDKFNPDPKQKNEPLLGLIMFRNFIFDGDNEWKDGSIYDPKNGKTYDCYMKFESVTQLKIRGYIGISLLGRTTHWFKTRL